VLDFPLFIFGAKQEQFMQTFFRWLLPCVTLFCLSTSYGCETTERSAQPQWVSVPVSDVSTVAGKWEGVMRRIPPERRDDWVTVNIASDGRYQFTSLRTIGVFSGHGEFEVNEGRLKSSSQRGTIEAELYENGSQRMLKAKGRAADGTEYTAEVKPAK
jgi:hypothetical protein